MGVTCQILFENGGLSLYRSGQPVVGTVKYFVDKPTEFISATVSLIGKGKCSWSEKRNKNRVTYTGTEKYVTEEIDLLQAKKHEIVTLTGAYKHSFHFVLPKDIPSSHKDSTSNINYEVQLRLVKPGFIKRSKKFSAKIPVYGVLKPYIPQPLIVGLRKKFIFKSSDKYIDLKAEIESTFINAGENIMVTINLKKETDIPIKAIRSELVNHLTYTANCKHERHSTKIIHGSIKEYPAITEKCETAFAYIIPTFPDQFTIQHSKILAKEYKVKLTVKLPFPHINAVIELPVIINKPNDAFAIEHDAPPSYWQVMNEDKIEEEDERGNHFMDSEDRNKVDYMEDLTSQPHTSKSYIDKS